MIDRLRHHLSQYFPIGTTDRLVYHLSRYFPRSMTLDEHIQSAIKMHDLSSLKWWMKYGCKSERQQNELPYLKQCKKSSHIEAEQFDEWFKLSLNNNCNQITYYLLEFTKEQNLFKRNDHHLLWDNILTSCFLHIIIHEDLLLLDFLKRGDYLERMSAVDAISFALPLSSSKGINVRLCIELLDYYKPMESELFFLLNIDSDDKRENARKLSTLSAFRGHLKPENDLMQYSHEESLQFLYGNPDEVSNWPANIDDRLMATLIARLCKSKNISPTDYIGACPDSHKRATLLLLTS